jgi:hypothetical protein
MPAIAQGHQQQQRRYSNLQKRGKQQKALVCFISNISKSIGVPTATRTLATAGCTAALKNNRNRDATAVIRIQAAALKFICGEANFTVHALVKLEYMLRNCNKKHCDCFTFQVALASKS